MKYWDLYAELARTWRSAKNERPTFVENAGYGGSGLGYAVGAPPRSAESRASATGNG
jgi:hypothetical protein